MELVAEREIKDLHNASQLLTEATPKKPCAYEITKSSSISGPGGGDLYIHSLH